MSAGKTGLQDAGPSLWHSAVVTCVDLCCRDLPIPIYIYIYINIEYYMADQTMWLKQVLQITFL